MTQLSRAASLEWQKAANRHTESLELRDSSGPRSPRLLRKGHRRDPERKIAASLRRVRVASDRTVDATGVRNIEVALGFATRATR